MGDSEVGGNAAVLDGDGAGIGDEFPLPRARGHEKPLQPGIQYRAVGMERSLGERQRHGERLLRDLDRKVHGQALDQADLAGQAQGHPVEFGVRRFEHQHRVLPTEFGRKIGDQRVAVGRALAQPDGCLGGLARKGDVAIQIVQPQHRARRVGGDQLE